MKKILISTVAAAMVTSSLMAATSTGPGTSTIVAGDDINGTVHSAAIASSTITLNASDSNITTAAHTPEAGGAWDDFITYTPAIAIGQGNLITIKVNNGAVNAQTGNNLYLVDANSSLEQNASGGPVVAKMTDFVDSAGNYSEMTFKFSQQVQSGSKLVMVNAFETNASLQSNVAADYGLGARRSTLGLVVNSGLACAENVTLEVINSKDQSADWFNVPNTASKSSTGVTVAKGVYVKLGVDGDDTASKADSTYDDATFTSSECPKFECTISLSDDEKAFGSSSSANATVCPTCTPETTSTLDLTCVGSYLLKYNNSNLITGGGITLSSIDVTTTSDSATMDELSAITGELNDNATTKDLTVASDNTSASGQLTNGLATAGDNKVELTYTADGTSVLTPTTFDVATKINTTIEVDTLTDFMTFKEDGTTLSVSYLSANPSYRSFVRVTSTAAATIQAIVTTEDGVTSDRVDIVDSNGNAVTVGSNGGAVVVEAKDILDSAIAEGFAGTGKRFNATIYVKTTGSVDAIAFQTDAGTNSQRYLPVSGATGGGSN